MKTIWVVSMNSDQIEARGVDRVVGAFFNVADASTCERLMKGYLGLHCKPLSVYDSIAEWEHEKTKTMRREALAKLTDDEKKVLGLE